MEDGIADDEMTALGRSFSSWVKKRQFLTQLRALRSNGIDSWAMYFAAFVRIRGLLVVIPENNLVRNIGFGLLSTHTKFQAFDVDVEAQTLRFPLRHPNIVENNPKIERLEIRSKALKWMSYPVFHPIDFAGRVFRYLKISRR